MRKHHYIALAYVAGGLALGVISGSHGWFAAGAFFALITMIGRG